MSGPAKPEKVKERVQEYARRPEPTEVSPGLQGAIVATMNAALDDSDLDRKLVTGWLFDHKDNNGKFLPLSSSKLSPQQLNGLKRWIGFYKEGDEWLTRAGFEEEVNSILAVVYRATGQLDLFGMGLAGTVEPPLEEFEQPIIECPQCGHEREDFDGLGFLHCKRCGYCEHASYTDGKCDYCGRLEPSYEEKVMKITIRDLRRSREGRWE